MLSTAEADAEGMPDLDVSFEFGKEGTLVESVAPAPAAPMGDAADAEIVANPEA